VLIEGERGVTDFRHGSARPCGHGSRISPRASVSLPEGTGAAVRPLPSAHCEGQEAPCCDNGDRPRARRLPVGDRSAGWAPDRYLRN
jgi:hypothetical protein